jgi:hypothetical protein
VSPAFAAGGTTGNVQGTIVDASGNAVRNATVSLASPSQSTKSTTDQNGFFSAVNLPVDTYTLSVTATGFDTIVVRGVTILGDQTVNIGRQTLSKTTQTIGRVTGRSVTSAFQPNQTTDQVTISGDRIAQAAGRQFNVQTQQLALSAPGVTLTSGGNLSVRGSRASDVGYQFEGIDFREPQAYGNASSTFNGLNSLQVVGGAGDATQGNVGSGVINITVKRGTYPAFGTIDLEGIPFGPQKNTFQGGIEYGTATRDNKISNYISYIYQRNTSPGAAIAAPLSGATFFGCGIDPTVFNAVGLGCNYAPSQRKYSDLIDNFIFRFGKDQDQSLQVLYRNRYLLTFGNLGGDNGLTGAPNNYYYNSPASASSFFNANNPYAGLTLSPGYTANGLWAQEIPILPGTPANPPATVPGAIESGASYLNFLDFAYTHNFGSSASATARVYNWQSIAYADNSYGNVAAFSGAPGTPSFQASGGTVTGFNLDATAQIGRSNTLQFSGKFEITKPIRDLDEPILSLLAATSANGAGNATLNTNQWLSPANTTAPVSASNPCPVSLAVDPTACYIYNYQYQPGAPAGASFHGQAVGRIPNAGVGYNGVDVHYWGAGLRDTIQFGSSVTFDIGGRIDGASYYSYNPYCFFSTCASNPQDVDPTTITTAVTQPSVFQPRASLAVQLSRRDAVRFSYGRSVNLIPGQGYGTPFQLYGAPSQLNYIPALDSAAAPECGNSINSSRAPTGPGSYAFVQCQTYGQQLYWSNDQSDAPDVGGTLPPIYNNYDVAFQHQFKNGMGLRLTGFYKRGYQVATNTVVQVIQTADPAAPLVIYGASSKGIEKTTGSELYFTLPDRREGFSGFLTATYINSFSNIPPGSSGEQGVSPVYNGAAAANNVFYRVGYISPVTARAGLSYRTHGFKVNPIFAYDQGYPVSIGNTVPFGASTGGASFLNGGPTIVTTTNLGLAKPCAFVSCPTSINVPPNYVDPAFPGSYLNPNIAATRGTNEGGNTGSVLSHNRLGVDIDFEYELDKRQTFGMYVGNVFNNPYGVSAFTSGLEPFANSRYQAVANGVAGPMTGTVSTGFYNGNVPVQNSYNGGSANFAGYDCGYCAYVLPPSGTGRTLRFYYQLKL